jgi:hypothetical protein
MERSRGEAARLRAVVASTVAADPVTYNEGMLGAAAKRLFLWLG